MRWVKWGQVPTRTSKALLPGVLILSPGCLKFLRGQLLETILEGAQWLKFNCQASKVTATYDFPSKLKTSKYLKIPKISYEVN